MMCPQRQNLALVFEEPGVERISITGSLKVRLYSVGRLESLAVRNNFPRMWKQAKKSMLRAR
jgi:hypothetical protein